MENRKIANEEINFKSDTRFIKLLDSLSVLYSLSEDKFLEVYKRLPYNISKFMRDTQYFLAEDEITDYAREIQMNYLSSVNKLNRSKYTNTKEFTLRNFHDLQEFLSFLNKMLYLYTLSPGHFMEIFPQCPGAYWDKIDDLRETSFKIPRDSLDFIESLKKCKQVSFLYSNYMDYLSINKLSEE